jgi:hypothetical protein
MEKEKNRGLLEHAMDEKNPKSERKSWLSIG